MIMHKTLKRIAVNATEYSIHLNTTGIDEMLDFAIDSLNSDAARHVVIVCSKEDKIKYLSSLKALDIGATIKSNHAYLLGQEKVNDIPHIRFAHFHPDNEVALLGYKCSGLRYLVNSDYVPKLVIDMICKAMVNSNNSMVTYGKRKLADKEITEQEQKLLDSAGDYLDVEALEPGVKLECVYLDHRFEITRENECEDWCMRVVDESTELFSTVCDGWISYSTNLTVGEAFAQACNDAGLIPPPPGSIEKKVEA